MKKNIVEKKEGIIFFIKSLFDNNESGYEQEEIEETIQNSEENESIKKTINASNERIKKMMEKYKIENFEVSSREKTPKVKKAEFTQNSKVNIKNNEEQNVQKNANIQNEIDEESR